MEVERYSDPMTPPYLPDCYWVEPGRLLAGSYPGSDNQEETRDTLGALLDCGIRTFVDLTQPPERTRYDDVLREEAAARGLQVTYTRVAIPDRGVPAVEEMRTILSFVAQMLADNAPVYVHCWGGIGRTGTVVGCWLAIHGAAGDDVFDTIAGLRRDTDSARWRSPESDVQIAFVRQWANGAWRMTNDE